MRMTQVLAENIATKLTEKKRKELSNKQNLLRVYLEKIYLETLPLEIVKQFKKHPEFFKKSNSIFIDGNGFNNKYITINNSLLTNNAYYGRCHLELPKDVCIQLKKNVDEVESFKENVDSIHEEVKNALINLRTFANVVKDFPEAAKHLPKENTCTGLIVNIDKIREKLN